MSAIFEKSEVNVFRYMSLSLALMVILAAAAYAVPDIQLFIDGATYDWDTQSWVSTSAGSVDLYVVSANDTKSDVIVCLALGEGGDPRDMNVDFAGTAIDPGEWLYGNPPLPPEWNHSGDLARHSIYPAYFAEVHTGSYGIGMNVGDVQPVSPGGEYWDPTSTPEFPGAPANAMGEWKMFTVDITGPVGSAIHFDAYTLNPDGTIDAFAPFSHDATTTIVPEPGTIVLLGSGLLGLGLAAYRKRKRS